MMVNFGRYDMDNANNFENRISPSYSDELRVYLASIYKTLGPNDDRLQLRILPYMIDIPDNELDNLPKFPAFSKSQVINGYTEYNDGKDKADRVYVLCTPDFSYGYVLSLATEFEGNTKSRFSGSYNFKDIKRYLAQRQCLPTDFEYKDIEVVVNSRENKTGGITILYNFRTGDYFIINNTGTIFTIQKDHIYMRVGSPSNPPEGKTNFSAIDITADEINFTTPTFNVNSPNIILGHHNLYLCAT